MKVDFNLEASLIETDDVRYTGPLGGWPFPAVNIFLVDNNKIEDATDLIEQIESASAD